MIRYNIKSLPGGACEVERVTEDGQAVTLNFCDTERAMQYIHRMTRAENLPDEEDLEE